MDEMLTDSFFLDISRMCKTLKVLAFTANKNITPEALHEVYKVNYIFKNLIYLKCFFNFFLLISERNSDDDR